MEEIAISEIQIVLIKPRDGLVAFASCVVNESIYLGDIGIYTSPSTESGYRLTYPLKRLPNGLKVNCCYPIDKKTGESLTKAIVAKYKKIVE